MRLFMRWEKLLFAHWEADPDALRALLPAGLELDTFEGRAFFAVVPFTMSGIRLGGVPEVPGTDAFHELNVRTYVRRGDRSGVWFCSLDASHRLAVRVARRWFHLRYIDADMRLCESDGWMTYESTRQAQEAPYVPFPADGAPAARLQVRYRPIGDVIAPSRLETWLTERYSLFSCSANGTLYRGDVEHVPWTLRRAEAEWGVNEMTQGLNLPCAGEPLLHYSETLDVWAHSPVRI